MKRVLYIGNKLEKHGATPTGVDSLPPKLEKEGYSFKSVSSYKNKALRLAHMMSSVLFKKDISTVLIDTYSTTNFWYAIAVGRLCRWRSIPYIMILHGGNLENRLKGSSESIIRIFEMAKCNVVPSDFLKEKLSVFQLKNLKVIPNSIHIDSYPFLQRKELDPDIIWVRAFDRIYNPKLALEVLKNLRLDFPEVKLCMVGPDKDSSRQELLLLAEENDLPVTFRKKMSQKEWAKLSKDYGIFINTTNYDNTPVSLIEAMALGLPIVSTNVGGIPYLIEDGVNGLLVDPKDPKAMAEKIKLLWENPELANRLSINGRKTAESFDWGKVKPAWLELLS